MAGACARKPPGQAAHTPAVRIRAGAGNTGTDVNAYGASLDRNQQGPQWAGIRAAQASIGTAADAFGIIGRLWFGQNPVDQQPEGLRAVEASTGMGADASPFTGVRSARQLEPLD